jgi:hypothetical protein
MFYWLSNNNQTDQGDEKGEGGFRDGEIEAQSNELTTGTSGLVQHFLYRGSSHRHNSAA